MLNHGAHGPKTGVLLRQINERRLGLTVTVLEWRLGPAL